jgi:hypothetical protein
VESHLSKRKKKISLKAKVLDAWNSMSEWNNVTVASYKPGGDCPGLVLTMLISIQTDLIALLGTMNDCRVSK